MVTARMKKRKCEEIKFHLDFVSVLIQIAAASVKRERESEVKWVLGCAKGVMCQRGRRRRRRRRGKEGYKGK